MDKHKDRAVDMYPRLGKLPTAQVTGGPQGDKHKGAGRRRGRET